MYNKHNMLKQEKRISELNTLMYNELIRGFVVNFNETYTYYTVHQVMT